MTRRRRGYAKNSQAKGPVSDKTPKSRIAAPKKQSHIRENLSGYMTGRTVFVRPVFLSDFAREEKEAHYGKENAPL